MGRNAQGRAGEMAGKFSDELGTAAFHLIDQAMGVDNDEPYYAPPADSPPVLLPAEPVATSAGCSSVPYHIQSDASLTSVSDLAQDPTAALSKAHTPRAASHSSIDDNN